MRGCASGGRTSGPAGRHALPAAHVVPLPTPHGAPLSAARRTPFRRTAPTPHGSHAARRGPVRRKACPSSHKARILSRAA